MSILTFDPKVLADKIATENMPAIKVYEVAFKACSDRIYRKIYCWQNPENGWLVLSEDDLEGYVENLIGLMEKASSAVWTDDMTYFEVLDEMNVIVSNLTGDMDSE